MNLELLLSNYAVEGCEMDAVPQGDGPIPARYESLFEACHSVVSGFIQPAEWQPVWADLADGLENRLIDLEQKIAGMSPLDPTLADALEYLLESLRSALEAVDSMGDYLETLDSTILDAGWMRLVEATQDIQHTTIQLSGLQSH